VPNSLICLYGILSTYQPINTSTYQHINLSTHQPINTSTYQHINLSTHQPINTSTPKPTINSDINVVKKRTPVFLLRQAHQNKTKNQLYLDGILFPL